MEDVNYVTYTIHPLTGLQDSKCYQYNVLCTRYLVPVQYAYSDVKYQDCRRWQFYLFRYSTDTGRVVPIRHWYCNLVVAGTDHKNKRIANRNRINERK
jgi:hypothetical protein